MPADTVRKRPEDLLYVAFKSRGVVLQTLFIAIMFVISGVLVILLTILLIMNRGVAGIYLFVGALGFVAAVLGTEVGIHTWPLLRPESVVVDLRSARLLEDGRLKREIVFEDGARMGISINQVIYVPGFKPLYGVEFTQGPKAIAVSPSEGYDLDYVRRLWPFALAITRLHDLDLTDAFKRYLRRESKKGGYWAKLHDELVEDEETLVQQAQDEQGETAEG